MNMATGDEWFFAILLLVNSGFPVAAEEAALRLTSADRLIRWYCAVYLGKLGDQRSISALQEILATPFPSPAEYFATRLAEWRYEDAKHGAAYILGELGGPSCAPSVRQALISALRIEQGRPPEPAYQSGKAIWSTTIRYLQDYENTLVYTLGRLKAFSALWGLEVSEKQLGIWRIHLIMGLCVASIDRQMSCTFETLLRCC
jgi:PBS lyase HEAT-like repeat